MKLERKTILSLLLPETWQKDCKHTIETGQEPAEEDKEAGGEDCEEARGEAGGEGRQPGRRVKSGRDQGEAGKSRSELKKEFHVKAESGKIGKGS